MLFERGIYQIVIGYLCAQTNRFDFDRFCLCASSPEKVEHLWKHVSDWWLGTWLLFSHTLGMSSSQLTNSYFSEGWHHQPGLSFVKQYLFPIFSINILAQETYDSFGGNCQDKMRGAYRFRFSDDMMTWLVNTYDMFILGKLKLQIATPGWWFGTFSIFP